MVNVLFFVPNLIGYGRLVLLAVASYFINTNPMKFALLYLLSVSLDFWDGWAAKKLNQQSSFGAWLDVVVDNVSRGVLWSRVSQWGCLVVALEWATFVGNHRSGGAGWKDRATAALPPSYVQAVMANGFKTPAGWLAIGGLHGLPLWLYAWEEALLAGPTAWLGGLVLLAGRFLCGAVEVWCLGRHIESLLAEDRIKKPSYNGQ